MKIYTARYNYGGDDRFDITYKGKKHLTFAPTKEMMYDFKYRDNDWHKYAQKYLAKVSASYSQADTNKDWIELLSKDEVTLVCFCSDSFCHRYLLVNFLLSNVPNIQYCGEKFYRKDY